MSLVSMSTPPGQQLLTKTVTILNTGLAGSTQTLFKLPKGSVIADFTLTGQVGTDALVSSLVTVDSVNSSPSAVSRFAANVKETTTPHPVAITSGLNLGVEGKLFEDEQFRAVYLDIGTASTVGGPWELTVKYYII